MFPTHRLLTVSFPLVVEDVSALSRPPVVTQGSMPCIGRRPITNLANGQFPKRQEACKLA